jgi:hypothetical protein
MDAWWAWSDAWIFIGVFVGLRIAFIWLATQFIVALIPEGNRCVTCGEETQPLVHEGGWHLLGQRFHRRFCLSCSWEGVARTPSTKRRQRPPRPPRSQPPAPRAPRTPRAPAPR